MSQSVEKPERCFDYDFAFVRGLPASFPDGLKLHPPPVPIDMPRAHAQHQAYTALLSQLLGEGNVAEVPADEGCPDCVFIEVRTDWCVHAGRMGVMHRDVACTGVMCILHGCNSGRCLVCASRAWALHACMGVSAGCRLWLLLHLITHPKPPWCVGSAHAHKSWARWGRTGCCPPLPLLPPSLAHLPPSPQDALLAVGSTLILTSPGAPERRPELPPVKEAVEKLLATSSSPAISASLSALSAPALLDGGDVLYDGTCLWVGLTARTNAAAVEQLGALLAPQGVVVSGLSVCDPAGNTLHLKVV